MSLLRRVLNHFGRSGQVGDGDRPTNGDRGRGTRRAVAGEASQKDRGGAEANRYAQDWNAYSHEWDKTYGGQYASLGDEWNDDGTVDRKRDSFYFNAYADRWLKPEMTVLEVGPGGGKWTVRLAPRVKHLIALDVAEEMLNRTQVRCESLGIANIEYVLATGIDFRPVEDSSVDFFFSYDVFVHIALEDTYAYVQEMARVLMPGGRGICQHAINSVPEAWNRIEQNNEWYRFGRHTLGQYYYYSPEALRRMYEHCGLRVVEQHLEGWSCTCVFIKPADDVVPRFEGLLRQLIGQAADDDGVRAEIVRAMESLPGQLEQSLAPVLLQARQERDYYKRVHLAAQIRHIWRGIG